MTAYSTFDPLFGKPCPVMVMLSGVTVCLVLLDTASLLLCQPLLLPQSSPADVDVHPWQMWTRQSAG